ncbi:hypothetical protein C0989_010165 [Termitomyces sp. Mn162]|nr:hypothetical protein C0989_010165 [Termitomyces sp. Mn162]
MDRHISTSFRHPGMLSLGEHLRREVPRAMGGPSYDEPVPGYAISSSKVSKVGRNWDTVLVARLLFKPDALEPTSL